MHKRAFKYLKYVFQLEYMVLDTGHVEFDPIFLKTDQCVCECVKLLPMSLPVWVHAFRHRKCWMAKIHQSVWLVCEECIWVCDREKISPMCFLDDVHAFIHSTCWIIPCIGQHRPKFEKSVWECESGWWSVWKNPQWAPKLEHKLLEI